MLSQSPAWPCTPQNTKSSYIIELSPFWNSAKLQFLWVLTKTILNILCLKILSLNFLGPPQSRGFNAKIGLKNGPPWAEILAKMFLNMACQTKPWPRFVFSQLFRPRVVRFSNRFLHWNRGIEVVVLSTIRCTNRVFKNRKIFPASLKNGLKNPKLREK